MFLQLVTAVVGTLYYSKYKNSILKYFLLLLWYIVLNDFTATYFSLNVSKYNAPFYNVFQLISFSFYLALYKKTFESLKCKKLSSYFIAIYYLVFAFNFFIDDFTKNYFSISYITGALFIVVSIIMYFSEILNSDKIIHINKMLLFWISIGLLVSFLPNIPFNVIRKYYADSPTIPYIFVTSYFLVIVNNLLLISGFVWSNEEQKDYL